MELKATSMGKRLAQHPYDKVVLLNAGVKVSGERHEYLIPFNQLLAIHCKRGLVWGELEFVLPADKVVRLHGTEWAETQRFHYHLNTRWQQWSQEMSVIAAQVLQQVLDDIALSNTQQKWLTRQQTAGLQQKIAQALTALPLPVARLEEFDNCRDAWRKCQAWLNDIEKSRLAHNQAWTEAMLTQYADFFSTVESSPLNPAQARAVVNGEQSLLVLAGAGSGKTSVLVARAGWLLTTGEAVADQILLLAFGRKAAQEMDERIQARLHTQDISARTFHSLALHIIQQGSKKVPVVSKLENDAQARQTLFIKAWRQQCSEKKAQAKGWRQWLEEELNWEVPEGSFWQDEKLARRLASRLDRWVSLMRMHGGSQTEMIESAPEAIRAVFSKRVKLMAPMLKAWKTALKDENAVDFSGLIHQAIIILEKGRFVSPWKHILVDEFQDISPQRAALLSALRAQNKHTSLFAVGDDWQAIYRFSGAQLSLTTAFHHYFGEGDRSDLDTTYRFNSRIGEIANRFIQQNPHQLSKPLNSLTSGDKKAVTLLADDQLEPLLDKLSGYAKPDERILVLARYHHLKPTALEKAATRWPKLQLDFMTIHASKGQQADYVIVVGLKEGSDGFPALARESVMEEALLPVPEDFPDAEERRLLYVAITRARHRVWLLFNKEEPSVFVDILKSIDVPVTRKP
ncbi:DNA helicase IV [Enterobacter hormaechei]|uniref:DNA helicase IV n=1 Tax=Enterobacter cloacae complex TaxID=354276 RepID=UPI0005F89E91|nr:DNA helicase IV [Enterobacter hormaechei]KJX28154.1 DNA helicase IV [Enterobacter hormaechei subsp. xiangfangensis]KUR01993.1 DNA helicase IV [Enterobacter hormaechei subsp. xiangfangensis]KZP72403.1 DNA helicase IV [Enterobacter hormaechei subsp. xiangfangensis]MCM8329869.1 DNA helicase IV [Enterobacter hormaechei]MCM8342293.1 DNA helicase IV [Enterobacter hormaechei]